jgi:5-methylcytosine-specific restriction enzyme B
MTYGTQTEEKLQELGETISRNGSNAIIALAGVPGTGKSFLAEVAAQRAASDPLMVREIQFHQSFSYEEFIEGMRIDETGGVAVKPGVFLEWNQAAIDDPNNTYVFLIEELTRANLSAVLGELMTYLEHRDRVFFTVYSRRPVKIAKNLIIMATYNPTDRSAIEVDSALLRRLRVVQCPPSPVQLGEMLAGILATPVVADLKAIFETCERSFADSFEYLMPFGHGIFAGVSAEQPDLNRLWQERIRHILFRPLADPHPFASLISENYPWKDPNYSLPSGTP